MNTDREFVNTLEDNIREQGAMDNIISDFAKADTSNRVKEILWTLVISDWQSESYHQNTNLLRTDMLLSKTARIVSLVILVGLNPPSYWHYAMFFFS